MEVILKHYTPLYICSEAIRNCWDSGEKSDTKEKVERYKKDCIEVNKNCNLYELEKVSETIIGEKDAALIERVANKFSHSSTLEHLYMNFSIEGISRALLQELARHRIASLSVKSTRYTLKELKGELPFTDCTDMNNQEYLDNGRKRAEKYLVMTKDERVNRMSILALDNLRDLLNENISNDLAKYALPEAYKTKLAWSINARSLQNFLSLRTDKKALWEIQELANKIYEILPEEYKYLFKDSLKNV